MNSSLMVKPVFLFFIVFSFLVILNFATSALLAAQTTNQMVDKMVNEMAAYNCRIGHLDVVFDLPFYKRIKKDEVKRLALRLLYKRNFYCERGLITLKGTPDKCNVLFSFIDGIIENDLKEKVKFNKLEGRISVGNIYLLLKNKLKWPVSVVAKDLEISFTNSAFARFISYNEYISTVDIVKPNKIWQGNSSLRWQKDRDNSYLIKSLMKCQIDVGVRKGYLQFKNSDDKSFVVLSGEMPQFMGKKEAFLFGRFVIAPGGNVAFSAFCLLAKGKAYFDSPLLKLAEAQFSSHVSKAFESMNSSFKVVAFANEIAFTSNTRLSTKTSLPSEVKIKGTAFVSLLDYAKLNRKLKWRASRLKIEPSIMLNEYR